MVETGSSVSETSTTPTTTMSTNASSSSAAAVASKKTSKGKKPRSKPTHPRTADMVNAAIKDLKEKGGSSLQAVKKYIASTYKIDVEKQAPFIKKYLKSAVHSGQLVQTRGKGAGGSFRLAVGKSESLKSKSKTRRKVVPTASTKTVKKPTPTSTPTKKKSVKKPIKKTVAVNKSNTKVGEKRKPVRAGGRPAAKPPKPKSATILKAKNVRGKKPSPAKKSPGKVKKTVVARKTANSRRK